MFALSLNHHRAPLDLRGRFAFTPDQLTPALERFLDQVPRRRETTEAAILSTCNRTELYCAADGPDAEAVLRPAIDWFAGHGRIGSAELLAHTDVLQGTGAARHAFRVACGLDSMVLGEPQILGQMKQAVQHACEAGTLGRTLHQLFQRSFSVAKEVRSSTDIGMHSVSLAATAVRLATQCLGTLSGASVLLIGAGEMIELCAVHFAAIRPRRLVIANRTLERSTRLAQRFDAAVMPLADLATRMFEFDVIISCTASSLPLIGLGAAERAQKARQHKTMVVVDLAVPRDAEPEVGRVAGIHLYALDDLASRAQVAGRQRLAAVAHADGIIEKGVEHFERWLDRRHTVPLIKAMNRQAARWQATELALARKRLKRGMPVEEVLSIQGRALAQKMLHGMFAELHTADGEERARVAAIFARTFLRGAASELA